MPDSLEEFLQHTGRAGRDPNVSASCILFYGQENKCIHVKHIGQIDNKDVRMKRIQKLSAMINFSISLSCGDEIIQRYFGYENLEPCRNQCDNCISLPVASNLVITADAKKFIRLISSVTNLVSKPSPALISKEFSGSCGRDIKKHKLDEFELHGCGKKYSAKDAENILHCLVSHNLLAKKVVGRRESQYGGSYVEVTPKGSDLIEGGIELHIFMTKRKF